MSPCPVEYSCIPGCSDVSSVVPVVEASFNLSGPAGQWLAGRQDQIVHVAGVPLSSVVADCGLVVVPSGCNDVGVERHKVCFFRLVSLRANDEGFLHVVRYLVSSVEAR